MNKICFGCGAKLQSEDKDKIGYIPEKKRDDAVYCMRCFRLMHYGENKELKAPKQNKNIIKRVNQEAHFSIFLIDFLTISEEALALFKSIKTPKVLIVNKCELMPKHVRKEQVRDFIATTYAIKDPILLKGGLKKRGIDAVVKWIEKMKIREAYILGLSNAGKSTFINDLMDAYTSSVHKITTSKKANTTLDFIRVPLTKDFTLIDSPGFILDHSLSYDTTGKNIRAITLQMKEGETASLLEKQYFFKTEEKTPMTFYTHAEMEHPMTKYFKEAPHLVNKIKVEENTDIVLKGIGFIAVKKKTILTTNVDVHFIEIRKSIFGGSYE